MPLADASLEQAVALYDPQKHRNLAFNYGLDPAAGALGYHGYVLWHMGFPDRALKKAERGVSLVQEAGHPNSLAMAPNHLASLHITRHEPELAESWAKAAILWPLSAAFRCGPR